MRKLNILIVDDIFTNRLLLSELIKTLGHSSVQAENGKEALDYFENNDIDLILMDIEMPVMNGLETCQQIRQRFPRTQTAGSHRGSYRAQPQFVFRRFQ